MLSEKLDEGEDFDQPAAMIAWVPGQEKLGLSFLQEQDLASTDLYNAGAKIPECGLLQLLKNNHLDFEFLTSGLFSLTEIV